MRSKVMDQLQLLYLSRVELQIEFNSLSKTSHLTDHSNMSSCRTPSLFGRIFCLGCCNPDTVDKFTTSPSISSISQSSEFEVYRSQIPRIRLNITPSNNAYILNTSCDLFDDDMPFGFDPERRRYLRPPRWQPKLRTINSVSTSGTMSSLSNLSNISIL